MLKPQDIMVLLKLAIHPRREWTYAGLAHDLGMNASEVHAALGRAADSRLFSRELRRPLVANLEEFVIHGLKYAYPPEIGGLVRGVPTAGSHPVFLEEFPSIKNKNSSRSKESYVWPYAQGTVRGMSLSPLFRSASLAAANDPLLYATLSLLDALRLDRKRETAFAKKKLPQLLKGKGDGHDW